MSYEYFSCPHCACSYRASSDAASHGESAMLSGYVEGKFFTDGFSSTSDYQLFTRCEGCGNFFWREEASPSAAPVDNLLNLQAMLRKASREEDRQGGRDILRHRPFFETDHWELLKQKKLSPENELYVRKKIWWTFNNEYRNYGHTESFPAMKARVLANWRNKVIYFLKGTGLGQVSTPYKYGRLRDDNPGDPKWALRAWLSFMCDKVYITLDENFEADESYDSRDYYPDKPTVNDVLFYEKMWKRWEQAEKPLQEKNLEAMLLLLKDEGPDKMIMKAEIYRCLGNFDACISLLQASQTSDVAKRIITEARKRNRNVILTTFDQYP